MFLDIVHDLVLEYGRRAATKNPLVSGGLVSAAMNGIQFTRLPSTGAVVVDVVETVKVLLMAVTIPLDSDSVNAPGAGLGRFPGVPISV
ncbi:hypothetical protein [Rhizobium leguminosarum]|uniref:hypothetical protein n=1 Tax=Rhizobium leguminosarum TaxID=384 RepID=UPI0010393D2A|nr:hypothetical protein [Rhizobium leguminosarum]TBY74783.1 hypothetical protein E0H32_30735 [Rhizobium leguminosarum bv. viciae]